MSLADVQALKRDKKGGLRQKLEKSIPLRPAAQRSVSENTQIQAVNQIARPLLPRSQTTGLLQPDTEPEQDRVRGPATHKRVKGLRPAPLSLSHDVSPADRAIPIGIVLPKTALSQDTLSPPSSSPYYRTAPPRYRSGREEPPPTIVVTPAKEDFDLHLLPKVSRDRSNHRPSSSVYSRHTTEVQNAAMRSGTRPVPPLPLSISTQQKARQSAVTMFEEDAIPSPHSLQAVSTSAEIEEDGTLRVQHRQSRRLTSQSMLPTPRRSRGWWNVVTSPFSASSKSNAFFWRSPSLSAEDGEDGEESVLRGAADMGFSDPHAGVIFTNRAPDDEELRSAPLLDSAHARPQCPQRSDSAPGAFSTEGDQVDIYRVPSQGLAAAYYDSNRRFPSLILDSRDGGQERALPDGWSPSQSVAAAEDARVPRIGVDAGDNAQHPIDADALDDMTPEDRSRSYQPDEREPDLPSQNAHQGVLAMPDREENHSTGLGRPSNVRNDTQATLESNLSPLSATPVVEHAHVATFMDPHSSNRELRQVELTPAASRLDTPPRQAMVPAEMAHRQETDGPKDRGFGLYSEKSSYRPMLHSRNDSTESRGLGILDSERELFPPPKPMTEKPRLTTDRFGQLTVTSSEEKRAPAQPWYRRFLWLFVVAGASLLVSAIVLLIIFVPQAHNDMPVEAQWLNTTGFPPIPTGVTTVIQPNVQQVSGCVKDPSLWSCAMPVQDDQTPTPPSFRFEIRFRNGSVPSNETTLSKRAGSRPAYAGLVVKRDRWASSLYTANPPAPSDDDQTFMGQFTDNGSVPYAGESTPFYISLLDSSALDSGASALRKRQTTDNPYPYPTPSNSSSGLASSNASSTAAVSMPSPALQANGKPASTDLYPLAAAQPLHLFQRGKDDEHYGFYTYFDRSVYVSNVSSDSTAGSVNMTGDVPLSNASAYCTWSQSRLHVQIWTRKTYVTSLGTPIPLDGLPAANSTANDMTALGSFPYAVTITLDRHGGNANEKGVYCYGLNAQQKVDSSQGTWSAEDRAFGGSLINAADVPGGNGTTPSKRGESGQYGGIDGGSGGCECQWQNWK